MRCRPRARRPRPVRRPRRPLPPRWLRDECGAGRDGCHWRTRRRPRNGRRPGRLVASRKAGWRRRPRRSPACRCRPGRAPATRGRSARGCPASCGRSQAARAGIAARSLGWPPVHGTDASSHAGTCGWTRRIMRVLRSGQQAGFQLGGSRGWNGWNRSRGYGPDPPWRDHGRPRGCARRRPRPRARNGLVRARPALTRHFQRHVEQPGAVGLARLHPGFQRGHALGARPRPPPW